MPRTVQPQNKLRLSPAVQTDLLRRLSRLEGQARGVQRMLQEQRGCREILTQLAAIRAAADRISLLLAQSHALECLQDPTRDLSTEEVIAELVSTLSKMPPTQA